MNVPFLDLRRGFAAHADRFDAAFADIARSGAYVLGRHVRELEAALARYVGTGFAVACNSGTDALKLALAGLEVGPGDEVITTPFTFAATVEAIEYVGATPVLVDIDPASFNLDPALIEAALSDRTRAIVPVHLFGLPAAIPEIMALAARYGLRVVEDCAQSLGARLGERQTGCFGDAGALSFYPTKTLGCFGDGGMVVTDDPGLDERLRQLRNHGLDGQSEHRLLGYNSRLDELQAAAVNIKLPSLDDTIDRRRAIAGHYNAALAPTSAATPVTPGGTRHAWGYYTILVEDRAALAARLKTVGIATALYYRKPLHRHAHFAKVCRWTELPAAEHAAERCLSLPIFPEMSDAEIDYVASTTARLLS